MSRMRRVASSLGLLPTVPVAMAPRPCLGQEVSWCQRSHCQLDCRHCSL